MATHAHGTATPAAIYRLRHGPPFAFTRLFALSAFKTRRAVVKSAGVAHGKAARVLSGLNI